jgi:hypothetical protein
VLRVLDGEFERLARGTGHLGADKSGSTVEHLLHWMKKVQRRRLEDQ